VNGNKTVCGGKWKIVVHSFCFDRYHTCGDTTGQPYQSDTPSDSSHCCVTGQSGGTYPCHSPAAWRQGIVQ